MKLHLQSGVPILVTGSAAGLVRVNADEYRDNVVLTPDAVHSGFAPDGFDALDEDDFAALAAHSPEIVLLGTGATQRFAAPRALAALTDARIGVETMTTAAACRTFNILVGEGRRVVAALIVRE